MKLRIMVCWCFASSLLLPSSAFAGKSLPEYCAVYSDQAYQMMNDIQQSGWPMNQIMDHYTRRQPPSGAAAMADLVKAAYQVKDRLNPEQFRRFAQQDCPRVYSSLYGRYLY